jgi:hypothetical protein
LDEVHGDDLRRPAETLPVDLKAVAPGEVLRSINAIEPIHQIQQILIIPGPTEPLYRIQYETEDANGKAIWRTRLAHTSSGQLRDPLTEVEARNLAETQYVAGGSLTQAVYLESTNSHHEYRNGSLPAFAFTFDDPRRTRIYVSSERGTVTSLRNSKWRIFDFLWMLHTMDYAGRDNFNNTLLRAFSILGLTTIGSGFLLFVITSPHMARSSIKPKS